MIASDEEKIGQEIRAGITERDKKLSVFEDQLNGYTSPFWESKLGDSNTDTYNPENHVYEYISYVVPQLAYSNPRVAIKSRIFGADEDMALMRYLMNSWSVDNAYGEFLNAPAHDICFNYAVLLTTLEDHPYLMVEEGEHEGEWAKVAKAHRISQRHYVRDPGAFTKAEARWEAHEWHIDKEDLIRLAKENEDDGWMLKEIQSLPETEDVSHVGDTDKTPNRKEIVCYDFYVREHQLEDPELTPENGFHGVIYTLAAYKSDEGAATMQFIREPRAFYGPPWGPYAFQFMHYVPDDSWGLSSLVAVEGQIRDLNMHARTMSKRAARRKRPVFVDESVEGGIAEKLQDARDDEVIGVVGFDSSKIYGTEVGGITDQDLSYTELSRSRLERVSGLSEQQRGQAGGADSATEAAIAKEGGDIRLEYTKLQFQRLVRQQLRTVAWYYHHDERTRHVVSPEAAEELGIDLMGGEFLVIKGGNPRVPFDQMAIEIEPMSMERTTTASQQRKSTELFGLVSQIAQMMPQMPYVDWGQMVDMLGESYNVPRLGELFDMELVSQFTQIQMQQGLANPGGQVAQNAQPSPSQPPYQGPKSPTNQIVGQSPFSGFSQGQINSNNTIGAA